jgi:Fe-S oxidoreductase
LLQDSFTSFYDPNVLLDTYNCLTHLGFSVFIAPFFPSGKSLHVKGFLRKFNRIVNKNNKQLKQLANLNITIVGIDPSITLTYRDEYQKITNNPITIKLLQEWLITKKELLKPLPQKKSFYLLSHCTEKSLCVESEKYWQTIFTALNLELLPLSAGCCGMAGSYGHELEHRKNSEILFSMDWKKLIAEKSLPILATGYSCRSQTLRLMNIKLQHPMQALANLF